MKTWKTRIRILVYSSTFCFAIFSVAFGAYHVSGKRLETEMVTQSEECGCKRERFSGDPYERTLRYRFGAFKGQCIDSCEYRNSQILLADEEQKTVLVSNVFHNDRFWTAEIPVGSVSGVDILFENFKKSFNHVAFRFQFDPSKPIELKLQNPKSEDQLRTQQITSLVISPEGLPPAGQQYNLKDGLLGNYALIYRVFSIEQYEHYAHDLKRTLRFYEADLHRWEMRDLLLVSLNKSSEGLNGVYQLFFNNCATATIDLLLDSKKKLVSESWDVWDVLDPLRGVPLNQHWGTLSSLHWWRVISLDSPPKVVSPGMSPQSSGFIHQ